MNFVRQIFECKADDGMHHKFVRYGKGEYERLYFEVSKGKSSLKVKSSFDFANDFVGMIAAKVKSDAEVTGKIIAGRDISPELKQIGIDAECSKRGKLCTAEISANLKPEQLRQVYEKFKADVLLLGINNDAFRLKTKPSMPKPGGAVKNDFCSATLPLEMAAEFVWETKDFSNASIKHILKIDEIVIPPELRNDPARARVESKRKGKIIRIAVIDGKEIKSEADFEA